MLASLHKLKFKLKERRGMETLDLYGIVGIELEALKEYRPVIYAKILNASRTYGAPVHLNNISARNLGSMVERQARRGYRLRESVCFIIRQILRESKNDIVNEIKKLMLEDKNIHADIVRLVSGKMKTPDDEIPAAIGEKLLPYRLTYKDPEGKFRLHILTYLVLIS